MGICHVPKIIIGSKNTEQGSIQIYGKDAEALILGDPTHEGGDVKIYRDASGNLQFSIDADAASNAIAMSVYGGVVAQHNLTVGQATLETGYTCYVNGSMLSTGAYICGATLYSGLAHAVKIFKVEERNANQIYLPININVSGTNSSVHAVQLQIDSNNIFAAQATGDGAGGVNTLKAIFYAPTFHADTPQTLTGAGAVNITTSITHLVTTGADALTLADGAEGQIKYIVMKTHGGNGTLTPAHFANGTTLTFDAVGDSVMLLFTNGSWHWTGGQATIGA